MERCVVCCQPVDLNDVHWECRRGFESGVDGNGDVVYEEDGDDPDWDIVFEQHELDLLPVEKAEPDEQHRM